jgi:hypothetical protein
LQDTRIQVNKTDTLTEATRKVWEELDLGCEATKLSAPDVEEPVEANEASVENTSSPCLAFEDVRLRSYSVHNKQVQDTYEGKVLYLSSVSIDLELIN